MVQEMRAASLMLRVHVHTYAICSVCITYVQGDVRGSGCLIIVHGKGVESDVVDAIGTIFTLVVFIVGAVRAFGVGVCKVQQGTGSSFFLKRVRKRHNVSKKVDT